MVFKSSRKLILQNTQVINQHLIKKARRTGIPRFSLFLFAWQRPSLPGPCGPSTLGAGGLNRRVRDGYGCVPSAMATRLFACRCASISFVTFCCSLGHVPISYAPSLAPSVPRISRASLAFGFRSAYVVLCLFLFQPLTQHGVTSS